MRIKVDCPEPLYNIIPGTIVQIKNIVSRVSDGSYLACVYNDKVIGMCDDIPQLMSMKEDDYIEVNVISSKVEYMNTILIVELL